MNHYEIHIGDIILQKLKDEKRSVAWLAGEISVEPSALRKKLKKQSMDSALLQRISNTLCCNFFQYYDTKQAIFS